MVVFLLSARISLKIRKDLLQSDWRPPRGDLSRFIMVGSRQSSMVFASEYRHNKRASSAAHVMQSGDFS